MLRCNRCKKVVPVDNPVISKLPGNKYTITAKCLSCNKPISKAMNKKQIKLLPKSIVETKDYSAIEHYKDEKTGGILPLLPLLGAIFGGIAAAGSTAGVVANSVLQSKKNAEQERHNREVERIATAGSGMGQSRTLDQIIGDIESIDDKEKRKLLTVFQGMGYVIV